MQLGNRLFHALVALKVLGLGKGLETRVTSACRISSGTNLVIFIIVNLLQESGSLSTAFLS